MAESSYELHISDEILELAHNWGWNPSAHLLNEWPTFTHLSMSENDRLSLAHVIKAAIARGEEDASKYERLAGYLFNAPIVFESLQDDSGGLLDMIVVRYIQ